MEEFKDSCRDLEVRSEEVAADLRDLPIDYTLAERYMEIDQEIYDMKEWYERVKKERIEMDETIETCEYEPSNLRQRCKPFQITRVFSCPTWRVVFTITSFIFLKYQVLL
jgi:hypothetical protein